MIYNHTILVVDDSENDRYLMRTAFAKAEFNCPLQEARNGEEAIAYLQGWLLFRCEVTSKDWEDRGGYMYGTTTMAGRDEFAGQTMKVWFKNENHIAWLDDQPFVTSPDPICLLNPQTGEGYSNTTLKAGDPVNAIGAKGVEAFRSERGLAAAGPAHFGFDMRYVPIEQAVQRLQQHSRSV